VIAAGGRGKRFEPPARMSAVIEWRTVGHCPDVSDISTTFTTTPKTVLASYRASHRSAFVGRIVVSLGLVVVGLTTASWVLSVLGVVYFALAELWVRRQLQPYMAGPRTVTVTMTDDEYRTEGPDRATSRTWSTFTSVRRVGEFWVLRISNAAAMALPASALDAQQTEAFLALARSKGLLRN